MYVDVLFKLICSGGEFAATGFTTEAGTTYKFKNILMKMIKKSVEVRIPLLIVEHHLQQMKLTSKLGCLKRPAVD